MTERKKNREGQRSKRGTDLFPQLSAGSEIDTEEKSEGKEEGNKLSAGGGVWTWMP